MKTDVDKRVTWLVHFAFGYFLYVFLFPFVGKGVGRTMGWLFSFQKYVRKKFKIIFRILRFLEQKAVCEFFHINFNT